MSDTIPAVDLAALAAQTASQLAGLVAELEAMSIPGREPQPGDSSRMASAIAVLAAEVMTLRFAHLAGSQATEQLSRLVAGNVAAQARLLKLVESHGDPDHDPIGNPWGLHPSLLPHPEDD